MGRWSGRARCGGCGGRSSGAVRREMRAPWRRLLSLSARTGVRGIDFVERLCLSVCRFLSLWSPSLILHPTSHIPQTPPLRAGCKLSRARAPSDCTVPATSSFFILLVSHFSSRRFLVFVSYITSRLPSPIIWRFAFRFLSTYHLLFVFRVRVRVSIPCLFLRLRTTYYTCCITSHPIPIPLPFARSRLGSPSPQSRISLLSSGSEPPPIHPSY